MLKETREMYSDAILHEALRRFEGSKDNCKDLGGFEAFVYEIEIDSKFYILKITHTNRRTSDYIMGELEFVNYLEQNGVPTSKAILSKNGNYAEAIDASIHGQFMAYVFEKAPGRLSKFEDWTDDIIGEWGRVSGMITRLSKNFTPSKPEFKRQIWHEDNIYKFERYVPSTPENDKTIVKCRVILDRVKSFPLDSESFGLVHGDMHQQNFFIDGNKVIPFDFDDLEYSYYVNEIAIPLYYATPKDDQQYGVSRTAFAEHFLGQFLKGYRKENQIDGYWIEKIPDFLMVRVVILFSLYHRMWQGEELNEEQSAMIDRFQSRIDNNIPYVDIDFRKFV